MEENIHKEIVKAVLYITMIITFGGLMILITDNSFILIISGMIIGSIYKVFEKWIDKESEEKQ